MSVSTSVPTGVGTSNGTSRTAPFDRWFRYPAGLSPDALEQLFASDRNPSGGAVVDPFAGAGTVGSRALEHGWSFLGIEAHPEIAELASLKLCSDIDVDAARLLAREVVAAESAPADGEHELVRRCFERSVLETLVGMRSVIQQRPATVERTFVKWALLSTLRDVANVKVGWPYLRPAQPRKAPHLDPAKRFEMRLRWMIEDVRSRGGELPAAAVLRGDSGDAAVWKSAPTATLGRPAVCLTSPPYLNNFDYADATRLETYFWKTVGSWGEMVGSIRSSMVVATTQQTSVPAAAAAIEELQALPELHSRLIGLVTALEHERGLRRAGKQYDRVLPSYFMGITRVLRALAVGCQPGSWCGFVVGDSAPYGVYVDTPGLIQAAAVELGFSASETSVLRRRGDRWRLNGTRHQVALDERLVWMRTPAAS